MLRVLIYLFFFFFNDTATTEIYTLSLHDALPILGRDRERDHRHPPAEIPERQIGANDEPGERQGQEHRPDRCERRERRSEEHTSELQSRLHLVCRLLL